MFYLLERKDYSYDDTGSMIVRANSEKEARQIANADEYPGSKDWDFGKATCEEISFEGESGILLRHILYG